MSMTDTIKRNTGVCGFCSLSYGAINLYLSGSLWGFTLLIRTKTSPHYNIIKYKNTNLELERVMEVVVMV